MILSMDETKLSQGGTIFLASYEELWDHSYYLSPLRRSEQLLKSVLISWRISYELAMMCIFC